MFTLSEWKVITIDGPAGSGKSTVAALLAERLGAGFLDTGAMYRAVTLAALQQNVDLDDRQALTNLARQCRIEIAVKEKPNQVKLNDRDVTEAIRAPEVTDSAHKVASLQAVREILVAQQRQIAAETRLLVAEGRDQGTVVFPQADFKFYLDAAPACRARRRWRQLKRSESRANISYQEVLSAQRQRDQRDAGRSVSPMKIPPGAIVIDTTDMTIEQVVQEIYRHVTEGAG